MIVRRYIHYAHRWLALVLGVQVALWLTSGAVMAWLPLSLVRGETTAAFDAPIELATTSYFPPGGVISQLEGATKVELTTLLGKPVYVVASDKTSALFDADTGARLSPLSSATARRVAVSDYAGVTEISSVRLLSIPPGEYKGPTPIWRVELADKNDTRLYISPQTGRVLARQNKYWRFYDFFWMFHIMDYRERDNFNNPFLRIFATTGFFFALTGAALVIMRIRQGGYSFTAENKKKVGANNQNAR